MVKGPRGRDVAQGQPTRVEVGRILCTVTKVNVDGTVEYRAELDDQAPALRALMGTSNVGIIEQTLDAGCVPFNAQTPGGCFFLVTYQHVGGKTEHVGEPAGSPKKLRKFLQEIFPDVDFAAGPVAK